MNLENMQKLYVLFDVIWRNNGMSYVMTAQIVLIDIFISNILKPTRSLRLLVQKLWLKQWF